MLEPETLDTLLGLLTFVVLVAALLNPLPGHGSGHDHDDPPPL